MNAHSYAVSKGVASLKSMAEVLGMTQKRLKEIYQEEPQVFDGLCAGAHYLEQQAFQNWALKHRILQSA